MYATCHNNQTLTHDVTRKHGSYARTMLLTYVGAVPMRPAIIVTRE